MTLRSEPTFRQTLALAAGLLLAASPLAAQQAARPQVDLACVAHGSGPQLECTVTVVRAGSPADGLQVTLGASMPSMPMAHRVKPVTAAPTGRPGEYRGVLALEMNGAWSVQVDLAGAVRDRMVRTLAVDECEGDRRCPVAPVSRAAAPRAAPMHKH